MKRIAWNRRRTRSRRKSYLCVRDDLLLICPEHTLKCWWPRAELNHRHKDFQSSALPTELLGRTESAVERRLIARPATGLPRENGNFTKTALAWRVTYVAQSA